MRDPNFGRPWWTRRDFLKGSAAAVAGAYGLSPGLGMAEQVPDKFDGMAFKLKAPEPGAKSGGVLRMGIPTKRSFAYRPPPDALGLMPSGVRGFLHFRRSYRHQCFCRTAQAPGPRGGTDS